MRSSSVLKELSTRLIACTLVLAGLLVLRWGLASFQSPVPEPKETGERIRPAAMFYTESPHALAAEKRVRDLLVE